MIPIPRFLWILPALIQTTVGKRSVSSEALQVRYVVAVATAAAAAARRPGLFVVLLGTVSDVVVIVGEPVVTGATATLSDLALLDDRDAVQHARVRHDLENKLGSLTDESMIIRSRVQFHLSYAAIPNVRNRYSASRLLRKIAYFDKFNL